ncbi:MAG: hypothetical protein AB8C02_19345 [Halioglobus sp.]
MKTYLATISLATTCMLTVGCAGSGGNYQPIVDGIQKDSYSTDLASCQSLSEQRQYLNGDVRTEGAAGAFIGALAGAEEGVEGAVAGAVVGMLLGSAGRAWDVRDEKKDIVVKCMTNRGHNVVG